MQNILNNTLRGNTSTESIARIGGRIGQVVVNYIENDRIKATLEETHESNG